MPSAPPSRPLLFNAMVMNNASEVAHGLWRHPDAEAHRRFNELGPWIELAHVLEKARFDTLFFGDTYGTFDVYGGGIAATAHEGMQFPTNDPLILAAMLAGHTSQLGFVVTGSIVNHPFPFARQLSTFDHLSGGRIGWNIVTSYIDSAARNFGHDGLAPHDERYAWADEYLQVVGKLWERSWDDDAVLRGGIDDRYADATRVRRIDHRGERYRVDGPHQTEPSPQRTPTLFQAGSSEAGREFAARYAEGVFMLARDPSAAARIIDDVRGRAVRHGRDPEGLVFVQGLSFVVGSTEEEARRRADELQDWSSERGTLIHTSGVLGADLAEIDLDKKLSDFDGRAVQSPVRALLDRGSDKPYQTVRELLGQLDDLRVVGTPEQIADVIGSWAQAGVGGINVNQLIRPRSFTEFAEHVAPVLRERGLMQTDYEPGALRHKLFRRGDRLDPAHPLGRLRTEQVTA